MSISSVTICSTRNDKRFETINILSGQIWAQTASYYCQPQTKSQGKHDV